LVVPLTQFHQSNNKLICYTNRFAALVALC
jgi:hypothetical protein